jgi:hypothetical protein
MKKVITNISILSALLAFQLAFADDKSTSEANTSQPEYRYNPIGKPDPFKPIVLSRTVVQSESQLTDRDLNDVRLVGTALGTEMSAVIMIGGKGVVARVGDKIGQKNGRIVAISNDKIIVRQSVSDSNRLASNGSGARQQKYEDVAITLSSGKNESTQAKPTNGNTTINSTLPVDTNKPFLGNPGN